MTAFASCWSLSALDGEVRPLSMSWAVKLSAERKRQHAPLCGKRYPPSPGLAQSGSSASSTPAARLRADRLLPTSCLPAKQSRNRKFELLCRHRQVNLKAQQCSAVQHPILPDLVSTARTLSSCFATLPSTSMESGSQSQQSNSCTALHQASKAHHLSRGGIMGCWQPYSELEDLMPPAMVRLPVVLDEAGKCGVLHGLVHQLSSSAEP